MIQVHIKESKTISFHILVFPESTILRTSAGKRSATFINVSMADTINTCHSEHIICLILIKVKYQRNFLYAKGKSLTIV